MIQTKRRSAAHRAQSCSWVHVGAMGERGGLFCGRGGQNGAAQRAEWGWGGFLAGGASPRWELL